MAGAGLLVILILMLSACGRPGAAQTQTGQPGSVQAAPAATDEAVPARHNRASFPVQTSEGGQVSVAVTWSGPATGLVFDVAMNTHSVNLDGYNLKQLAVLRTDQGQEVRPSGWETSGGGHHRAGTLIFPDEGRDGRPVLGAEVHAVTLVIRDVAGVPERSFQWTW
ncbi:MAG TPA: hypothetical protein DEP84_27390 [Chloroflexi bacterium]|nr:hypothetical protein [Chloroflexota bacterium]